MAANNPYSGDAYDGDVASQPLTGTSSNHDPADPPQAHHSLLQETAVEEAHHDAEAGHAPPAYEDPSAPPAVLPRRSWAQRTRNAAKLAPPGSIQRTYQNCNLWLMFQWILGFFVLGSAATVVQNCEDLEVLKPYAAVALTVAILNVVAVPWRLRYKSASATTAKPPVAFTALLIAFTVLWAAASACGIVMVHISIPYRNELDMTTLHYSGCGKYKRPPCHYATKRSGNFQAAMFCMCFAIASLLTMLAQAYQISRFFRKEFDENEVKREHDYVARLQAKRPKVHFRQAFKDGWKQGKEMEKQKEAGKAQARFDAAGRGREEARREREEARREREGGEGAVARV